MSTSLRNRAGIRPSAIGIAIALFTGAVMLAASLAPHARACSCVSQSLDGARDAATAVFEGRLLRFETANDVSYAVFRVNRVWKGRVAGTVRVRARPLTMCPPHLEAGQTRIVYATGPAADLRVEACSRTAWSSGDAAALGPSHPPRR